MLSIISYQGNTSQNHSEIPPHCTEETEKKTADNNQPGRVWTDGNSHTLLVNCKMVQPLWKNNLGASQNVKHGVTIWHNNFTPRNMLRRNENMCSHKHFAHKWRFTAALFMIAQKRRQPRCPSTDERVNKMWSVHTRECYLATKGMKY